MDTLFDKLKKRKNTNVCTLCRVFNRIALNLSVSFHMRFEVDPPLGLVLTELTLQDYVAVL